ncbi:MAG: nitronate monooxygenase [Gammaproteobacteria bacterium]|nr:nitronate monooxygenase [Gammaproteobacteria bacterium]
MDTAVTGEPALAGNFPPLRIREKSTLPVVQGGMGVGVSAHRLAGAVAACGAVGTISSVDLRRHHADLMEATGRCLDKEQINAANLTALDREIRAARGIAGGRGLIAVNVMRALSQYAPYVRQACESGADAVVVGAGLPLDLPELTAAHPRVALIPILSDVRGVGVLLKKWMRKGRLPDAVVIEHPRHAGGHLGAASLSDVNDSRFDFEPVLEGLAQLLRELALDVQKLPIILAGGINTHEKVRRLLGLGASAVQLGTAFAVTEECDAHPTFKRVLAEARPEDIVTFMSVAGLPARAVRTPWLDTYLKREARAQSHACKRSRCIMAFDCLISCGLRDGLARIGQFCIDNHLAAALRGDLKKGLFFRGSESLPFGSAIRPVRELLDYLLTGLKPAVAAR